MTVWSATFNDEDRCFYFDLSADEMDIIDAVHTRSAAVHLALQLVISRLTTVLCLSAGSGASRSELYSPKYFPGMAWQPSKISPSRPPRTTTDHPSAIRLSHLRDTAKVNWNKSQRVHAVDASVFILRETLKY